MKVPILQCSTLKSTVLEHGGWVLEHGGWVLEHGGRVLERGGRVLEHGGWRKLASSEQAGSWRGSGGGGRASEASQRWEAGGRLVSLLPALGAQAPCCVQLCPPWTHARTMLGGTCRAAAPCTVKRTESQPRVGGARVWVCAGTWARGNTVGVHGCVLQVHNLKAPVQGTSCLEKGTVPFLHSRYA